MSRNLRTSLTDPIQIPTLSAAAGRIGVSFCSGKRGPAFAGFDWKRDLAVDLDAVRDWGAAAVVSLIEDHEIEFLGVSNLEAEVTARGMEWLHLPIVDVTAPGDEFEQRWRSAGPRVRGMLAEGRSVFIHCRGGLGRAGTVAARLLIELGEADAAIAIARVREVRPGAIETRAQENHLHALWRVYDRACGCLIGLAVGDALGTTLEFKPRDSYDHITDMVGGAPSVGARGGIRSLRGLQDGAIVRASGEHPCHRKARRPVAAPGPSRARQGDGDDPRCHCWRTAHPF